MITTRKTFILFDTPIGSFGLYKNQISDIYRPTVPSLNVPPLPNVIEDYTKTSGVYIGFVDKGLLHTRITPWKELNIELTSLTQRPPIDIQWHECSTGNTGCLVIESYLINKQRHIIVTTYNFRGDEPLQILIPPFIPEQLPEESEEDIRLRPYQLRITTTGLEAPGNENVWQKYFKTSSELGLEIATALHLHEHGSYGNTKLVLEVIEPKDKFKLIREKPICVTQITRNYILS